MSQWIEVKKEDIKLDGDEINIYFESDDFGARYIVIKIKDIEEIIKTN